MKIIPAIDLLDGQVVRLFKGDYDQKNIYGNDPVRQAALFSEAGFDHLHIVDLNGARSGRFENLSHIRDIIRTLGISVQAGGGVRSLSDLEQLLEAGVSRVICSSMAVRNPEEWQTALERHPDRLILGMDLKEGKVAYGGWLETAPGTIEEFLQPMIDQGLQEVLSTDISLDGTLSGPNVALYEELIDRFPEVRWIASGGVSEAEDLDRLKKTGVSAVVVGKAYYEGRITLEELKNR